MTPTDRARLQLAGLTSAEIKLPFDRFALLPNSSKYFSCVKTVVNARFCPTDSCSHRQPIVEQYEKVQNLILILFDNLLVTTALDYLETHPDLAIHPHEFLSFLANAASSPESTTNSPSTIFDSWVESKYMEFIMRDR